VVVRSDMSKAINTRMSKYLTVILIAACFFYLFLMLISMLSDLRIGEDPPFP
jgi:hypothetical protein